MSGRKNVLPPFQNITSGDMSAVVTSTVTDISWVDNVALQLVWTGNPTGTFTIEVSADYAQDTSSPPNVTNSGTWTPLSTTGSVAAAAGNLFFDINQISAPYIRAKYTPTGLESADVTTVADTAGSLNSKYWLLNGANGTNWYIWYNINSAGVDPAVAGRTGIQVTAATNANASAIATATRSALAACTSITTIAGATSHVTFTQTVIGHGSMADGTAATGFTFTYTAINGTLQSHIAGKMV